MCVIVVKERGINIPKKKILEKCYNANSDGMGLMYVKGKEKTTNIRKDFSDFESFYNFIQKNISKNDLGVFHFRFATSGKIDKGNSHPFPISNNSKRLRELNLKCLQAVVHNGVISEYSNISKKYSDTQKFILDILSRDNIKLNLKDETIQKLISKFIGNDKLAIIDKGELVLVGNFINKGKLLFSNLNWENSYYFKSSKFDFKPSKYSKVKNLEYKVYDNCEFCGKARELTLNKDLHIELCSECMKYFS